MLIKCNNKARDCEFVSRLVEGGARGSQQLHFDLNNKDNIINIHKSILNMKQKYIENWSVLRI